MAWNASNNQVFFERLKNWAKAYQGLRDEGQRLTDIWNSEGVSSDPAFDDQGGITTDEATALMVMLADMKLFTENGLPSQGDRVATLSPFIVDVP